MSKLFNFYKKGENGVDVDICWYDSSNVLYSECEDPENKLKTLTIVFKNGSKYRYKDVESTKYLLFREDASQGKALNKYIKGEGYEYEKLDNADVNALEDELKFRDSGGLFITYDGENLKLINNKDSVIYENKVELTRDAFDSICGILTSLGKLISQEFKEKITS